MGRAAGLAFLVWVLAAGQDSAGETKYSIKSTDAQPPTEFQDSIRGVLDSKSIQLIDDKGRTVCEVWFRRSLPVKATPEQLKTGLTYRDVEESTLFGGVRFDELSRDYKKQKIKPGVYTLRLGFQPVDGDHMGTAPYPEFLLLLPAKLDQNLRLIERKELQQASAKAIGRSHPGVLLLYPNDKPAQAPTLDDKGMDTWVLNVAVPLESEGKKSGPDLGVSLTLIGHSTMD